MNETIQKDIIAILSDTIEILKIKEEKYFMELNLGSPESPSCEPAKLIYRYVRPYKIKGEADFLGVAGYPETLECGKRARIPCADRSDISRIIEFIETS